MSKASSISSQPELVVKYNGAFTEIIINRPQLKNALNGQLIDLLTQEFDKISANENATRAVLLRGEGGVFCSGADLNEMKDSIDMDEVANRAYAIKLRRMFTSIRNCSKPVVCFAEGRVYGGALGLIACADIVVCSHETQFCFSEVNLGIAPAVISGFIFEKIEMNKIFPWMITGEVFNADTAKNLGLVHELGNLNQALHFATRFAATGPNAVSQFKKLAKSYNTVSFTQYLMDSENLIANLRVSPEGQEGIQSFLAKKKPSWTL